MIDKILERLNSLSEDAQNAALGKAKELNYNVDKGIVSMNESLINLNGDIATLRDAIEKQKLNQLPLSIQKSLHDQLVGLEAFLGGMIAGKDEVINLTNAIEALHASVWTYGLQNLSPDLIGYETKLNQVKHLEVQVAQLKAQLEQGVSQKSKLEALLEETQRAKIALEEELSSAKKNVET